MPGASSLATLLLVLPLLLAVDARASDLAEDTDAAVEEEPDPTTAGTGQAEYVRLQQELERLAARSAWSGVERTLKKMIGTGVPPSFEAWLAGAHAARAVGDIAGVRQRLLSAHDAREDKDVLNWLWEIDANYGRASLACTPGRQKVELEARAMPFNPDQRRAVEFAVARIDEACLFDGYLPQGVYEFGGYEVKVVPRVQTVSLDLRNMDPQAPSKKKRKKE